MNRLSSLFASTIILFALFHVTSAQNLDSVTITGQVVDQTGAIVPGAEIRVITRTGQRRTTTTNDNGQYQLIQLEPGNYVLQASSSGFAFYQITSLSGLSAQTLVHDIVLLPATVEANTVVVSSSDQPAIDTRRTLVGTTLNTKQTELLPIAGRSVLDLIFTLPGTTEEPLSTRDLAEDSGNVSNQTPEEAGTFSLAGAPAYSNNLTIDGLDNNDDRAARERFQPPLDAVEEVQVITNQFSAEYGRASGGRVNLRTRGGTSQFGGRLSYLFRDEALNANTFRNNSLGLPRLPLQDHTLGVALGGPVLLPQISGGSKSLFFFAYELNKTLDSALIDTLLPTGSNSNFALPQPNTKAARLETAHEPSLATEVAPYIVSVSTPFKNTAITARGDHQFNELHSIAVVYQGGRLINLRQFSGGNRLAESLQGRRRSSDSISFSDTLVLSSTLVNQGRFQFSRLAPSFKTGTNGPVVLIAIKDALEDDDPAHRSGTVVAGSSTSGGSDRRESRLQFQDVLSVIHGNHSLKFGLDIHHVQSTFIDLADVSGTFNFASAGDFLAGIPSRFRQSFNSESTQKNRYFGIFAHDEWQILPQLLVSYGLRYERESILRDRNNFGPRFSLAYSPSRKLVVRFGGGIFYNRVLLRTIDDFTLGKQQVSFDTNALIDPATGKVRSVDQRRVFIESNLQFPRILNVEDPLVTRFGSKNLSFIRRLDPTLRIPESYQANLGVERDLGAGFALEANLTFTRGIHLWREFNANAPRLPAAYKSFTDYLSSRDFPNFFQPSAGGRPLYNATSAGELVRFVISDATSIDRLMEFGVPVSVFNLSHPTSSTLIDVALAALNPLRPDPGKTEVEQLISAGNSFYHGLTIELRRRVDFAGGSTFRAGYTLSKLVDDGVVNTSDALAPGDFRAERARSLLDRRHRFVFSGTFALPGYFGGLQLSPLVRVGSSAPFNISLGGADRNLDDVGNDRPNYDGELRLLWWRGPGSTLDPAIAESFSQPVVGQSGNLPRNAGRGPGVFIFDFSVTREFRFGERLKLRPLVEFDNVLNKTVFSFGAEFIDFNDLDSFLLATRTARSRQIRLGLKIEF